MRSAGLHLALAVAVVASLSSACSLPRGSMARPVQAASDQQVLIAGGATVPFAAVGAASTNDGDIGADLVDGLLVIPSVSFDYAFGNPDEPRRYFGVDVSIWSAALSTAGDGGLLAVFVNPRFEYGLSENLSFTVDGNLGYLGSDGSGSPFIAPTLGLRGYIPVGGGGLILSQQIGSGIITVTLPGSLAFDLPVAIGPGAVLHVFPELRWDPTFFFIGDESGVLALFSAGLSFMFQF